LVLQQGGERTFAHAAGGGVSDLLQGKQIGVQAGTRVAIGPVGDNFAPLGG
jgi:hypothetical protein